MVALVTMVTKLLSGHVYPSHPLVFTSSTQITQSSSHQAATTLVGMASPSAAVLMAGKIRRDSYFQKPSAGQRPEEEEARTRNESSRSPKEERASSFFRGDTLESERSEDG